jgi:hypothetical protein
MILMFSLSSCDITSEFWPPEVQVFHNNFNCVLHALRIYPYIAIHCTLDAIRETPHTKKLAAVLWCRLSRDEESETREEMSWLI